MIKLGGVVFYIVFMALAITSAVLAIVYLQRAYNGVNNSERDTIHKILVFDYIVGVIMTIGAAVAALALVVHFFIANINPRFILFPGLLSFLGILFFLSAFYLIYVTIQLVTTILPKGIDDVKHDVGLSAVFSIACAMFTIIAIVGLLVAAGDVVGDNCVGEPTVKKQKVVETTTVPAVPAIPAVPA